MLSVYAACAVEGSSNCIRSAVRYPIRSNIRVTIQVLCRLTSQFQKSLLDCSAFCGLRRFMHLGSIAISSEQISRLIVKLKLLTILSASRILQATNFFTLQAINYSFLLSAIHFPAHLAICIVRWLTHIIPETRRYLPDSLTIFQLPKS